MSGVVGDKQWKEFRQLESEYIDKFGEVSFTTFDLELDEIIVIFKKALASGKPVNDDFPDDVFI